MRFTKTRQPAGDAFSQTVLPHLDSAYNLARWLLRDPVAAEDVVQESMLRAFTGIAGFRGENPRAWLLQIVRNTAMTYLARERRHGASPLDEGEGVKSPTPRPIPRPRSPRARWAPASPRRSPRCRRT